MAKEWGSLAPKDPILLQDVCFSAAAQAILLSVMGPIFHGTKEADEFIEAYHKVNFVFLSGNVWYMCVNVHVNVHVHSYSC